MTILSRRALLSSAAAVIMTRPMAAYAATPTTLRDAAQAKKLLYGTSVSPKFLDSDRGYSDLVAKQAGILVCEGATKRKSLQPERNRFNFEPADAVWTFAKKHDQQMRGHTFVWHESIPDWLLSYLAEDHPKDTILTDYISVVGTRYKGRTHSWDVVNEVIDANDDSNGYMRTSSPWYKAFGEHYIDIAFHAAKEADPNALLFLNETNMDIDNAWSAKVRKGVLDLIDRLLARNVPIEGFGIQAHLKPFRAKYTDEVISKFMDEVMARGLKVLVTEMDISDIGGSSDLEVRDDAVASLAKRYLDVAFSKPHTLGCLTWGMTDRYSWLNTDPKYKWQDGQLSRALPFDSNLSPKPMFDALMRAYENRRA